MSDPTPKAVTVTVVNLSGGPQPLPGGTMLALSDRADSVLLDHEVQAALDDKRLHELGEPKPVKDTRTLADLKALAEQDGIDTTGLKTKADVLDAIERHTDQPADEPEPTTSEEAS